MNECLIFNNKETTSGLPMNQVAIKKHLILTGKKSQPEGHAKPGETGHLL